MCLFCNIQFYFCCLGKFFFSVQQFIFLLFRQAVENFLVTKKETVNTLSCTNRHQQSFCYLSSFFDFSIFTFFFSCGICFASFIFSLTDGFSSFFSTAFSFRYCSADSRYSANGPVLPGQWIPDLISSLQFSSFSSSSTIAQRIRK